MFDKSILYNKNISVQGRFLAVLISSYDCNFEITKVASLMGTTKAKIEKLVHELMDSGIIESVSVKGLNGFMNVQFKNPQTIIQNIPDAPIFRKPIPPNNPVEVIEFFTHSGKTDKEAMEFWNYYEAVGWYAGNQPILNWRAKAQSWSDSKFNKTNTPSTDEQQKQQQKKREDFWGKEW